MSDLTGRGHVATRPDPGAFRCLVCKVYIQGTASGHCPRCGFVPPSAPRAVEPAPAYTRTALQVLLAIGLVVLVALVSVR